MLKNARGVTLTELMVATALLSVGILAFFSAFKFITVSISVSRARTLATNLAQEKVEVLKNLNYYQLLITTSSLVDNSFTPGVVYDAANYPPETISIGGMDFKRYTYVSLAQVDNNAISTVTYTYPDTGMKQITVHITWSQGAERKKWTLSNLLENPNVNPLDSSFSGTISSAVTATPIAGALVKVQENPDWNATTDAAGYYSFRVYHGSYTIRASSSGWYDATSAVQTANTGSNSTLNMSMSKIASGTISGLLWLQSYPVISQVVGATNTVCGDGANHDVEYVELFNPTTYSFNVGQTNVYPKALHLNYYDENVVFDRADSIAGFNFVHVTTHIAPKSYYLVANATWFFAAGAWRRADSYYGILYTNIIRRDKAGALQLTNSAGAFLDTVGWKESANNAPRREGDQLDLTASDGLGTGTQIVRVSSPAANILVTQTYGRAYDSDNNNNDFLREGGGVTGIMVTPRSSGDGAFTVVAGKPGIGAYVAATDALSGSTRAISMTISSSTLNLAYAYFKIGSVSTGTWSVIAASGTWYKEVSNVIVGNSADTPILNAVTTPVQVEANNYAVHLDSSHTGGFVAGRITTVNGTSLAGITVDAGGVNKTTGSNGTYFAKVSSGPVTVIANPNNANSTYQQGITLVDVAQGQIIDVNFILSQGGTITGFVTTGTTPLPNIIVTALIGGNQYGTGTSDAAGSFYIRNLSTGTYDVAAVLEAGQDSSPNSYTGVAVAAAATVNVGTFTVSGAFGTISGEVRNTGTLVTTGALILASTSTLASTPPSIAGSSSPALTPIYAVSSKADGTYQLPVRGGAATYRISAYVPTISAAGTVTITTKTYTGISVSPSAVTTQNISIP